MNLVANLARKIGNPKVVSITNGSRLNKAESAHKQTNKKCHKRMQARQAKG